MKALWPFVRLFKRQWLMMALGMLLATLTIAAGIGLLSLSGWFLSATAVAGLSVVTAQAFNFFTPAGGVRFLSIARTASRYGERLATHEATFRLLTDLRCWSWKRILPLSAANLQQLKQADILNRLVADIDTLDHVYLRLLTPMLVSGLTLFGLYFFLSWFDAQLALILCGLLLAAWIILPLVFYRLGKQPGIQVVEAKRALRVSLIEYLQGMAELSLFGASQRYNERISAAETVLFDNQRAMVRVAALSQASLVLVNGTAVLLMLFLAASGVGEHQPPGPMFALMVFAAMASIEMMMPVAGAFSQLSACIQAAERVSEVVDQSATIVFDPQSKVQAKDAGIVLNDVHFSYVQNEPVLTGLNLTLQQGTHTALLGQTGCGKSTILALISRQWQAERGAVKIGGYDVREYSEVRLREMMTVVSQRVYIFSASLRENLMMAAIQKQSVDDFKLMQVLKQVGLANLLEADRPLDQFIGDGGRTLSGGEQRRIGVARALLRDAPILLLDEPTEGLDKRTEKDVMSLLLDFSKGKTLLMISHRLVGMAQMDEIHLMNDGKIRASGNHQQLLATDPAYANLYHRPLRH